MADNDCCNSFGGRIAVEVDGVPMPPVDAEVTIFPADRSVQAMANGDGTMCAISTPALPGFRFKFRLPCGLKFNAMLGKCKVNAHIFELDNDREHIFTGGRFVGEISYSVKSGEVDGGEVRVPAGGYIQV